MKETNLYHPVKALFEDKGFTVKAEIGAADMVARHDDGRWVVIELKLGFTLNVLHQAIARQSLTDDVYIAIPRWKTKSGWKTFKGNLGLCKRLGLGLIAVDSDQAQAKIYGDPKPYQPRKSAVKKKRLQTEFTRREGDPNIGGSTQVSITTSYKQDAIRCLKALSTHGPGKGADIAKITGVPRATRIMADNHYGWFQRISRGVYGLTEKGQHVADDDPC